MRKISTLVLAKLPYGKFIKIHKIGVDMDGNERTAIVWSYVDRGNRRWSNFCIETGMYLGEEMV